MEKSTGQPEVTETLTIAGKSYASRLIIGTDKYKSDVQNAAALEAVLEGVTAVRTTQCR